MWGAGGGFPLLFHLFFLCDFLGAPSVVLGHASVEAGFPIGSPSNPVRGQE